jgi:regulator of protease activity HflC (stomatin/prohibitin superfamily)
MSWFIYFIIAVVVIILLSAALKIVQEYERGGVFRLGRWVGLRGPGLVFLIPFIERMRKVDLRVITMDVPQQECMSVDNVTVTVDAVIYFRMVEVKDVQLPQTMQRAMAAQAEAERDRRAKVVHAEGEYQAAQKLADAAQIIGTQPAAIQLRYLQALSAIATEKTNTILFPIPIDIMSSFLRRPSPELGRVDPDKK